MLHTTQAVVASLRSYRLRAVLAAVGIGIGTATIILLANLVGSVFQEVSAVWRRMGSDVILIGSDTSRVTNDMSPTPVTLQDAEAIRRYEHRAALVVPRFVVGAIMQVRGEAAVVRMVGVTAEDQYIDNWRLSSGRFVRDVDIERRARVCVLGRSVATRLEGFLPDVNDTVTINGAAYTVIGHLRPRGQRWGLDQDDIVLVPLASAEVQAFGGRSRPVTLIVTPVPGIDVGDLIGGVRRILRRSHRLSAGEPDDFTIGSQAEMLAMVSRLARLATAAVILGVGWSLVVAAIGVLNSVMTAVLERTSEIGLRRVVGATRVDIREQYFVEALAISGAGSLAGALVGVVGSLAAARLLDLPTFVNWPAVAFAVVAALCLGLLAGVWPAVRASMLNPIDAVRHE